MEPIRIIETVDEGIAMTGKFGFFQKIVPFILIIGYMTGEIFVQNMAYLELMPAYECKDSMSDNWARCYPTEFCREDGSFSNDKVRVNSEDPHSLNNWVDQLNLTCVEHSSIGLLGTMLFLGWMTSSIMVPRLSDIYGRKKFFLGFHVMQVLAILAMLYTTSISSAFVILFMLGFSGVGRSPIVYIYIMEMLTPAQQKVAGPIFASSVAVCLTFGTIMLQFVSKDTSNLLWVSIGISIIIMIVTALMIPESPKFLHAQGRFEECR